KLKQKPNQSLCYENASPLRISLTTDTTMKGNSMRFSPVSPHAQRWQKRMGSSVFSPSVVKLLLVQSMWCD
ncbi:hypothetical protein, partial [Ruegeria faecimaris]|uniref:hypothetical protein n=1 Tax=Ruegeria faecimaris TaxID=686389 RepID=UPI0024931E83